MSNKGLTLFVFEGRDTEGRLIDSLERNFLGDRWAIKCVFDAEIYQLYEKLHEDAPLDLVKLLADRYPKNREVLEGLNQDSFAYIYLFFDYDAHATGADDEKIRELLHFFDNETENGKLFISYPMVEAIRHYRDAESFKTLTAKCVPNSDEPRYKQWVAMDSRRQLTNINKYTRAVWCELITAHLMKMNYIVWGEYEFPHEIPTQNTIFDCQCAKYICASPSQVAVLSAIPIFVLDYYGVVRMREILR